MPETQPDRRIKIRDLGVFSHNGQRFVINNRPGVPRNACIEEANGYLRCWASHEPLAPEAAEFIRRHADFDPKFNRFTWKDGFYLRLPDSRRRG